MMPTIGRIVLYHSSSNQIFPAIVTAVGADALTLTLFTPGGTEVVNGVLEGTRPGRWEWMPYQKGQAAKTEAVEKELQALKTASGISFGAALIALKEGGKAARSGWNGKGIFIELQQPDANSKMTHPYIFIDTTGLHTNNPDAPRSRVPWLASQTDMLSEDWLVIP